MAANCPSIHEKSLISPTLLLATTADNRTHVVPPWWNLDKVLPKYSEKNQYIMRGSKQKLSMHPSLKCTEHAWEGVFDWAVPVHYLLYK